MKNTLKNFENELLEKDFESFDADGYDADGFDADGYDADGFDAEGYDMDGNYDESYDEGYDEGYDDFNGKQSLSLSEQVLDVVVTNSTGAALSAKLFAGNRNGNVPNYNNPAGIVVTSNNSVAGYGQLLETVKSQPMTVTGMTIFVANAAQLSNQVDFIQYQAGGSQNTQPFRPSSRRSPTYQQPNIIEVKNLKFDISGNDEMSFVINANEQVTFTLFVSHKVDLANLSRGRSVMVQKRKPRRKKRFGKRSR